MNSLERFALFGESNGMTEKSEAELGVFGGLDSADRAIEGVLRSTQCIWKFTQQALTPDVQWHGIVSMFCIGGRVAPCICSKSKETLRNT
jgi:hypothetical protein